jgi:hypothetical protein
MIIKELSNKELVKGYKEARKVFIKAVLLSKEEEVADNILDMFYNEMSNRKLDLRNYL